MKRTWLVGAAIAAMASAAARSSVAADCASLSALKLEDTTITRAEVVAAGTFALPPGGGGPPGAAASFADLPAFCRVSATLKPSPDSDIKVEVWLPLEGWNRKFQAVGNGGWLGAVIYPALGAAVRRGYAAASTDTGHAGGVMDASFGLGHPEKVTDFAWRAVHLMTVRAKEVVKAFYGDPAKLSYWNGCSSGGKQGLKEAQRFPEDFDGIVAGAPANNWTHLTAASVWVGFAVLKEPSAYIPPPKYGLIHEAALSACDGGDGVKDGVIDDPRQCRFDPAVLLCKDADGPNCLTAGQVASVKKIYGPATFSDGRPFFPGLEPGSELGWGFLAAGPEPTAIGSTHYRYLVHADPQWNPRTMDFDKDVPLADQKDQGTIAAIDPNLRPFKGRGGKLILYHGWADALIVPRNSIDYYDSVVKEMGGLGPTQDFARLFMAPGVGHCGGGPGPDQFDALGALEAWVEKGQAPEVLIASRRANGVVDRSRPLCAYPKRAKWKGTGSTDEATNFTCVD